MKVVVSAQWPMLSIFSESKFRHLLANADGHLDKSEEEFFNDVIPPEFLPLESLMKKDPVNSIECEEVSEWFLVDSHVSVLASCRQ